MFDHCCRTPLQFVDIDFILKRSTSQQLKQAHVTPILKSGDAQDPEKYRPISVTSELAKVLEKILKDQLTEYLNRINLVCPSQFGYRKKMSTSDAHALILATKNKERNRRE